MIRSRLLIIFLLALNTLGAQSFSKIQGPSACGYGLKNDKDEWVAQPVYTILQPLFNEYNYTEMYHCWLISTDGHHYGLLDSTGQVLFQPVYKNVREEGYEPTVSAFDRSAVPYVNSDSIIIVPVFPRVEPLNSCYLSVHLLNGQGFADKNGKMLTDMHYAGTYSVYDCYVIVFTYDREKNTYLYGCIDSTGHEFIPTVCSKISPPVSSGIYCIRDDKTYFVSWKDGKFIPVSMDYCESRRHGGDMYGHFSGDAPVLGKQHEKYGLMDGKGLQVLPPVYDSIYPFWPNGICKVGQNGKYGLVNYKGEIVLPVSCDSIQPFGARYVSYKKDHATSRYVLFERNGKWGIFSDSSGIIIKPKYAYAGWIKYPETDCWLSKGKTVSFYKITRGKKVKIPLAAYFSSAKDTLKLEGSGVTIFVNSKGEIIGEPLPWVNDPNRSTIGSDDQGILSAKGSGLISGEGKLIVPPVYKRVGIFTDFISYNYYDHIIEDGYLYAETWSGKFAVYNHERMVIDSVYETFYPFDAGTGIWIARKNEKSGWDVLDSTGKRIAQTENDFQINAGDKQIVIHQNGNYKIIRIETGENILPGNYASVLFIPEAYIGMYQVTDTNGKTGLINASGEWVFPCIYDRITGPFGEYFRLYNGDSCGISSAYGDKPVPMSLIPLHNSGVSLMYFWSDGSIIPGTQSEATILNLADTSAWKKTAFFANNFLLDSLTSLDYSDVFASEENYSITAGTENSIWMNEWYSETSWTIEVTEKTFTLSRYEYNSGHGSFEDEYSVVNYLLAGDSARSVELYDLLDEKKDASVLNDTIRHRLAREYGDYFSFDCSNSSHLDPDYFFVTDTGITFCYLSDSGMDEYPGTPIPDRMLKLNISWKELKGYLRKEIKLGK